MPLLDGMDLIREVHGRGLPVTVIVTTAHGSADEAVRAIRLGAYEFLTKPIDVEALQLIVRRALQERRLQDEVARLREELRDRHSFHNVLSKSPQMHAIFELIDNVACTTTTVLIEGETGTGKEQIARAIHEASAGLRKGPFVAINCAALPEALLESELFGHEKGSFTGAVGQRRGRFEMADGGTLFLDEVGDIPAPMQAKLLRVLQERRFERVGGAESLEVDVRVISATNRPLQRLVRQGKFREDLFYRFNVIKIDLPPLRERLEDVPLLAGHFARKYAGDKPPRQFAPEAMQALLGYRWPGNVRELENAVERACVVSRDGVIRPDDLPAEVNGGGAAARPSFPIDLSRPLPEVLREAVSQIEMHYIRKALQKTRGHVSRCARVCGLSRRTVTAKIAEYKLDKGSFKGD
jgi:DNA-binding NtrC family response regulator